MRVEKLECKTLWPVLKKTHCTYLPGVEWILVHRRFPCNSKNPRMLAPLIIIFQQNLKYKSCRVNKIVPKFFSNYFLTPSGSVKEEKLNIKNLWIK
jgi:hypothetical protein